MKSFVILLSAAAQLYGFAITEETGRRIPDDEVVATAIEDAEGIGIEATSTIREPLDRVWALWRDFESFRRAFKEYESISVVASDEGRERGSPVSSGPTRIGYSASRRLDATMRTRTLAALAAAISLLSASCAKAPHPDFAAEMDAFCRERRFNGSILIAERGVVLFSRGYGYADFAAGRRNDPQTPFRIASVTKSFTAACALILRERGLIDLDDPVAKFIDDYPRGEAIRIVDLLAHASGIPEYANVSFLGRADRPFAPNELLKYFRDKPLRFAPGTAFEYSGSNYVLLGAIIERVSGMPYGAFLEKNLFEPLGMRNTRYGPAEGQAVGYQRIDGTAGAIAFPLDLSSQYASGGVVSTVEDLSKWDRALYGTGILRRESLDRMFERPFGFSDYGLGWRIARGGRRPVAYHSGPIVGGSGHLYRDARRRRAIVILSNVQDADLLTVREKALDLLGR